MMKYNLFEYNMHLKWLKKDKMLVKIRYITSNNTDALTRIFYENGEKFSEPQYSSVSLIYS